MRKRIVALMMALVLVMTMLPMPTWAAIDFMPIWPIDAYHINALDHYSDGTQHNGIDIAAVGGSEVRAVADGKVVELYNGCTHISNASDTCGYTWGNYVLVEHTINGTTYQSRYAHLQNNSIVVSVGSTVLAGQKLALSGSSGSSTGYHLHLELYQGSRTAAKACQSFQYYLNNLSEIDGVTFSSHIPSSSVYYGDWVGSNCTLSGSDYVYNYKNTGTDTVRPENIVDLGDDFYSPITHMSSLHYLCNVAGNVELGDEYITGALWHFIKQSDGSYKILNGVDGKVLDVYNNDTEDGTNIQVYAENGTTAQRWYIVRVSNCYSLISAESGKALDIENNSAEVGANAQLYTANGTEAQVLYFANRLDYAHGVTADRRKVSLSMEYDRIQTVLLTVYGEFESTYEVDFSCDSSVISCSWQAWDGMSVPLRITANKSGTDTITVSLRYAGSEDVLSSTTIEVTVTSDAVDDDPATPPAEDIGGTCGENLTWVLDSDGTLTISGTGNMADYGNTDNTIPWLAYIDTISSVVIEDGVTSISDAAFLACTNLIDVTIPASVTSIGDTAFSACSSLDGIYVNINNPKYSSDEYGVLFNKDKTILLHVPGTITNYRVPEGVKSIGESAFSDCTNLTSITIPTSITNIGDFAFNLCDYLTDVYYGGSEAQWNEIAIGDYNYLDRAAIHFTVTPPTEPKPTEPKPTEPKPTEPKPTEPKPTEPKPTEPKPTEPKPTEPKPTEPDPTTPPVSSNPFVDVTADAYYFEPVQWAVENGITTGMDATHFAPDGTCTRAQIVTFLWRANGSPAPASYYSPFTDVPAGQWYSEAVLWAVEKGITTGTSATTFSPDAGCTRGQVATFLWRSQTLPASVMPVNSFTDIDPNAYYYNAVLWAVENGITNGLSATAFGPDATCTRGQIVTFLFRNDSVQQYINRYTFHKEDVTWSEANEKAKELGGHLVHLDSIGEMGYLMARIYEMDYEFSKYILLGGKRDADSQEFYWRDTDGNKVGGSLNEASSWQNALWLMGEPSLGYAGEWEDVMSMSYSDKDGRWGWNDVPDDLPATLRKNDPSQLGTIIYIVEYEK